MPSGYIPGEVDYHAQWSWEQPYVRYAEIMAQGGQLARVAAETPAILTRAVTSVPAGSAALVISTAAPSNRCWWRACRRQTTPRGEQG